MKLNELFKGGTKFTKFPKLQKTTKFSYNSEAQIGDQKIAFKIEADFLPADMVKELGMSYDYIWIISFADNSTGRKQHDLTGKGNEFKVFEFVMQMIDEFLEAENPELVEAVSTNVYASRVRLYERMARRFRSKYIVSKENNGPDTSFLFIRKDLPGAGTYKPEYGKILEAREFTDDENGSLTYGWKSKKELAYEEDNKQYIPAGYTKVLELGGIYANEPGKGQGDVLMKKFLSSPEAQKAELIFLDPVPGVGANFGNGDSTTQVRRLMAFYRKYGFKNNPKSNRMWLVKKGSIPDDKLPT